MTRDERKIRFDVALEIVERVYSDYCHDDSATREQAGDFCEFVQAMIRFSSVLDKEAKEAR